MKKSIKTKNEVVSHRIIAGKLKGRAVSFEFNEKPRPTTSLVRGALFNILGVRVVGNEFLDIFSGSGMVAFEALSRGASSVTMIEQDIGLVASMKKNVEKLNKAGDLKTDIIAGDFKSGLARLGRLKKKFKYVFIDPPYGKALYQPAATALLDEALLDLQGMLFIERRSDEPPFVDARLVMSDSRKYGLNSLDTFELIA
jgi:16S rRNA (guanine(966)-N(2))-methyltransferase RsmD